MELGAKGPFHEVLEAVVVVPGQALEEGINQRHQHEGRDELRIELGAFGDAARDDRRNGGREGQEEEELHQVIALGRKAAAFGHARDHLRALQEANAVSQAVADEEIGDGGGREIHQDLHERVDLRAFAHGTHFEKREARVHGEHHDRADQNEKDIRTHRWILPFVMAALPSQGPRLSPKVRR